MKISQTSGAPALQMFCFASSSSRRRAPPVPRRGARGRLLSNAIDPSLQTMTAAASRFFRRETARTLDCPSGGRRFKSRSKRKALNFQGLSSSSLRGTATRTS
jgi:hypothetical protein